MAALYFAPLSVFLQTNTEELLGHLTAGLASDGFDTTKQTTFSWQTEILALRESLHHLIRLHSQAASWTVLLEYVLPVVGRRVDCVLIADDVLFVIEYKGGSSASARAALQQAQDYAVNLIDFHEASKQRTVIPIGVGAFKTTLALHLGSPRIGAAVQPDLLAETILSGFQKWAGGLSKIDPHVWNHSRYFPVPTIVQAACAIYEDHDIRDLAHSRAGTDNLEATQMAISDAVRDAQKRGSKTLIVVTGVPGAGKTLAGLNAVQNLALTLDAEVEQAAFMSGNTPLVKVLQTALRNSSNRRRSGLTRSVESRVREIHRFVKDTYGSTVAPVNRIIVFDEAQRAWTAAKNVKKFDRNVSEPEMVLEIMGRHAGWAVVVALVGGGQEIHAGEAGLAAWGDALVKFRDWEIVTSPEAVGGGSSVAGSRLFRAGLAMHRMPRVNADLHLKVSRRSYESETTAEWVNAVLHGRRDDAARCATNGIPIHVTRSLERARQWLRSHETGHRRVGLIASSGAARLRAEGVEPPTFNFLGGIDYVKWFLEPSGDHRSSNQLEVALSEFEMQGLEIDVAGLLWGGDLVYPDGQPVARSLRGSEWRVVRGVGDPQASAEDLRTRIQNKYRVLLTRFRKAMVIFVPIGSTEDPTRAPADFDGVYNYLLSCGVRPLDSSDL